MGAMKVWDGTTWQTVAPFSERASCFVGPDAPAGVAYAGDLWWDTDDPTIAYPGAELHYSQITANVSVTATTTATAGAVLSGAAVTYDGSPIVIEFSASSMRPDIAASAQLLVSLYDGNTELGILCRAINPAAASSFGVTAPGFGRRRLVPTVGPHTYNVRASVSGGTGTIVAGDGSIGANVPAVLRITRV